MITLHYPMSQIYCYVSAMCDNMCDDDEVRCAGCCQCIAESEVCDGQADCPGGTDEYNCGSKFFSCC